MDLNNYWQENKRFVAGVGVGIALFAIAWYVIDGYLGNDLREQRSALAKVENDLKQPLNSAADLDRAREDHAALVAACEELTQRVEFVPRPEFRLEKGAAATNRYFSVFERVRDELRSRAGRAGVSIPEELGMPGIGPTKEILIARHLEALDVIDHTLRLGIQAGVKRLAAIRVKLDPRILSGKPFDDLERTRVEFEWVGDPLAMTRLFVLLQEQRDGRALVVDNAALAPAQGKSSSVTLELTLLIAHLNRVGATDAEQDASASASARSNSTKAAVARSGGPR